MTEQTPLFAVAVRAGGVESTYLARDPLPRFRRCRIVSRVRRSTRSPTGGTTLSCAGASERGQAIDNALRSSKRAKGVAVFCSASQEIYLILLTLVPPANLSCHPCFVGDWLIVTMM